MKAFKNGLVYFIKTQLMFSIVFNIFLALSYILMMLIRGIVYSIIENRSIDNIYRGSVGFEVVLLAIPMLTFFFCGLYYKQKKKPSGIFSKYLAVVFPIILVLTSYIFHSIMYGTDFNVIPWIEIPYNWIIWIVGWAYSEESNLYANNYILIIAPYFSFLVGYIIGERPFSVRIFKRIKEGIRI